MAAKLPSTQSHLDIADVEQDLVLLKNGNLALVMETSSLNFELLAEDEQEARIVAFASLLNSVSYPMQIVIRTERKDMNDYIDRLIAQREQTPSATFRRQMEIYIKFIQNLTFKTDILQKRFFVVITSNFTMASSKKSLFGGILGKKEKPTDARDNITRAQDYLYPKRDSLIKQFQKMGIRAVQLKNDQLVQLFYEIYDPDKVGVKRVELSDSYTNDVVASRKALIDELG